MSLSLQVTLLSTDRCLSNADHMHQMVHAWNTKEYGTGSLPWTGLGSQVKSLRSSLATHPPNALLRCFWTVVISSLLKNFGNEGSNTLWSSSSWEPRSWVNWSIYWKQKLNMKRSSVAVCIWTTHIHGRQSHGSSWMCATARPKH